MVDLTPAPLMKLAAMSVAPQQHRPTDIAGAVADFIRSMADRAAKPTDGLPQKQAALSWSRQIALEACLDTFNPHDDRYALLDALHDAERTVWNATKLNELSDTIMEAAEGVASTLRYEADVLNGVDD